MRIVAVGNISIGSNKQLPLIAGPCVIESSDHCLRHAEQLKKLTERLGIPLIFKSSYDKANRLSLNSFRGPVYQNRAGYKNSGVGSRDDAYKKREGKIIYYITAEKKKRQNHKKSR